MATKKKTGTAEDYELLTMSEVAALTGVSKPTISRACTAGELGCVRFGTRAVRIPRSSLEAFIDAGGVSFTASHRARKARNR